MDILYQESCELYKVGSEAKRSDIFPTEYKGTYAAIIAVRVRKYDQHTVILETVVWCARHDQPRVDIHTHSLMRVGIQNSKAIRLAIIAFDALMTQYGDRLFPFLYDIPDLADDPCTCTPDHDACPSCRRKSFGNDLEDI